MREYDGLQHDAVCVLCRTVGAVGFDALSKSNNSLVKVVAMSNNNLLCRRRLVNEEARCGEAEQGVHKAWVRQRHVNHESIEWIVCFGVYVQDLTGMCDEVRE